MYKRILVPLDGSELAEQVLPYARTLGRALGTSVELLRSVEPVSVELADPEAGVYLDGMASSFLDKAQEYLEQAGAQLREAGLEVTCVSREGSPATHIVDEAAREPGTIVAISTRLPTQCW